MGSEILRAASSRFRKALHNRAQSGVLPGFRCEAVHKKTRPRPGFFVGRTKRQRWTCVTSRTAPVSALVVSAA